MAAAAQADGGPAAKSERLTLRIEDLEVAFYLDRAVVVDGDLGGCRFAKSTPQSG